MASIRIYSNDTPIHPNVFVEENLPFYIDNGDRFLIEDINEDTDTISGKILVEEEVQDEENKVNYCQLVFYSAVWNKTTGSILSYDFSEVSIMPSEYDLNILQLIKPTAISDVKDYTPVEEIIGYMGVYKTDKDTLSLDNNTVFPSELSVRENFEASSKVMTLPNKLELVRVCKIVAM